MRIPERYDQLEDDGGDTILPIHKSTDLAQAHNDDRTLAIELMVIENNFGHIGNETDMKNTIDTVADVIAHQVLLEAIMWMRIPERYDQREGDGGDDSTLAIELATIENNIGHSGNEIDMSDMKNTIDTVADVITHQVTRFDSSGMRCPPPLLNMIFVPDLYFFECRNRFNVAVSSDTSIQSNNVEANFCFHRISVFGVRFLKVENRFPKDTSQDVSQ